MIYEFSTLTETIKTKADFDKWVDERLAEIDTLVMNRREIYPRELRNEKASFESIKNVWDAMNTLRKESPDYDITIVIDKQGYHTFKVRFPITNEERIQVIDARNTYCAENDIPRSCAYISEWYWKYLGDKVKNKFHFAYFESGREYQVEDTAYTNIKKIEVYRFK